MRTRFFPLILLFPTISVNAAQVEKTQMKVIPLSIKEEWTAPYEEISGLRIWKDELYLVSDNALDVARLPWLKPDLGNKRLDLTATDKRTLIITPESKKKKKKQKKSQWEAIAVDSSEHAYLLKENKGEIHVYTGSGKSKSSFKLKNFSGQKNDEKGFEGLALMKSGHFLVALTQPPILVEYGPKGDKVLGVSKETLLASGESFSEPADKDLHPLQSWNLTQESGCEFADLATGKEGKLYALLKDCNRIIEVPALTPKTQDFTAHQSWSLPQTVPHPEGLESLGDEGFLVASDVKAVEKNLFWLAPAKANP